MEEYDVVRVVRLLKPNREFDGSEGFKRAPQVGDTGTIVHVYPADKDFIIEAVAKDGYTIWLADFSSEELEKI